MTDFSDQDPITRANLLKRIEHGWTTLHAYLTTLSESHLTIPTDAAGWTAKDHIIHMALWEDGLYGLLNHRLPREEMGIDAADWTDDDHINAVLQQRYRDLPLTEVMQRFQASHTRLLQHLATLTDADLIRPYTDFQQAPDHDTNDEPIVAWIAGNTFMHYAEHTPWIAAIVGKHVDSTP